MARAKNSVASHRRHKKILKASRGRHSGRHRLYKTAHEAEMHALDYAYIGRRLRKRQFRRLWIIRINAAAREQGLTYSRFMNGLLRSGVEVDRKVLADLAVRNPEAFAALADRAKSGLAQAG